MGTLRDTVPAELQNHHNWVCGRLDKSPVDPKTGRNAKANDPSTWGTFAQAVRFLEARSNNGIRTIGFEVGQSPFTGIDLDHCRNPETDEVEPWATKIIQTIDSYTEVSPSGRGIRMFVNSGDDFPPVNKKTGGLGESRKGVIEIANTGKYFSVTGNHLEGTPSRIYARKTELREVLAKYLAEKVPATALAIRTGSALGDDEILHRAGNAANGEGFKKLYAGDYSDYPSQSEADLALCCHLAFWTSNDAERIDRLFRQSGLYREKWEERHYGNGRTYGQATIEKALENGREPYRRLRSNGDGATAQDISTKKVLEALDSNEDGDAALFVEEHQGHLAYDHSSGSWYVYDGHHWHEDTTDKALALVQRVIDRYAAEAEQQSKLRVAAERVGDKALATDHEEWEAKALKRIRALQSLNRKTAVLKLAAADWSAQDRPSLALTGQEWDKNPMLLGCANGVIDLRSGKLRSGVPEDYVRTYAPTEWQGLHAPAPEWDKFLTDIFNRDEPLIAYIQRLVGYASTGSTCDHAYPILYGPHGRNGKGTLLETLGYVLGPLAGPIEAEMLLIHGFDRHSGGPTSDIMALRGKRLVWASETGEGRHFNVGKTKWLTGGDTLTGRAPYGKRQVSFRPTHKMFLLTNDKPHASATDDALWARLHLIPFTLSFVDNPTKPNERKRDASLPEKLKGEASAILAWLVRGCLEWQTQGLNPPEVVRMATEEYRKDEDLMGLFLSECCTFDKNAEVPAGKLYEAYQRWCAEMGHKPVSGTKFGKIMKERFDSYPDRRGVFYIGLGLRAQEHKK
jgi:putative DNA primase/helicase